MQGTHGVYVLEINRNSACGQVVKLCLVLFMNLVRIQDKDDTVRLAAYI